VPTIRRSHVDILVHHQKHLLIVRRRKLQNSCKLVQSEDIWTLCILQTFCSFKGEFLCCLSVACRRRRKRRVMKVCMCLWSWFLCETLSHMFEPDLASLRIELTWSTCFFDYLCIDWSSSSTYWRLKAGDSDTCFLWFYLCCATVVWHRNYDSLIRG